MIRNRIVPPVAIAIAAGLAVSGCAGFGDWLGVSSETEAESSASPLVLDRAGDTVIVGKAPFEVEALLGPPTEKRKQPPAEIWRYAASDCAVDIYFYLDAAANRPSALHVASPAGPNAGEDLPQQCLNRVHDARQADREP